MGDFFKFVSLLPPFTKLSVFSNLAQGLNCAKKEDADVKESCYKSNSPPENAEDNAKNHENPPKDDQHKGEPVEAEIASLKIKKWVIFCKYCHQNTQRI